MFLRRASGLFDFAVVALCVWAALHHTPVGAVLRRTGAALVGIRSSAGPLLSYYGGGNYAPGAAQASLLRRPLKYPLPGKLTEEEARAIGVYIALSDLEEEHRAGLVESAARFGAPPAELLAEKAGPRRLQRVLADARRELGSEDAAVGALFFGYEAVRFARGQLPGGEAPTLERLSAELPPGFEEQQRAASLAMALGVAYGLGWPVPDGAPITSPFGMRVHPIHKTQRLHTGVDISVPVGTDVRAASSGVVRRASEDAINGKVLVIDHGHGVTTAYCHNSWLLVSEGERVERGQHVARSGNSGQSTGPHLHYQLEIGDSPVDPLAFVSGAGRPRVASGAD